MAASYSVHADATDPFDIFLEAYRDFGNSKYMIEEEITQVEHAQQAAYLAQIAGAPEEVVIGLLFHDVGQVIHAQHAGNTDVLHPNHAEFGGAWLREQGFPELVSQWVESHALAKVMLCEDDPGYYDRLSKASQISYRIQRKKYFDDAHCHIVEAFRANPHADVFKLCRRCDDMAKITDLPLPSLESYREMTARVRAGKGAGPRKPNWKETIQSLYQFMARDRTGFEAMVRQYAIGRDTLS